MRKVKLSEPDDACEVVRKIINKIFLQGTEVDNAGRIANLLAQWAKCYELGRLIDIERRLAKLEGLEDEGLRRVKEADSESSASE